MKLLNIYLRPERHADMVSVESARAVAGLGLEGDYFNKKDGKRQVTILTKEDWDAACQELSTDLDPITRRANLLVNNIQIKDTTGQILQIGDVFIQIEGETKPCRIMDDTHQGLKDALSPDWRGGVYGKVIFPGILKVGDEVSWKT